MTGRGPAEVKEMMTTDYLVRKWEAYCEQLDLSPDAVRRIEDAQEEIGKALKRISQAMDLISSACDRLETEEIIGRHDRIESYLLQLEDMACALENDCDRL